MKNNNGQKYIDEANKIFQEIGVSSVDGHDFEVKKNELGLILETINVSGSITDLDKLIEKIIDTCMRISGSSGGLIAEYNKKSNSFKTIKSKNISVNEDELHGKLFARVKKTREPELNPDICRSAGCVVMCLPMIYHGKFAGAMCFEKNNDFSKRELYLMTPLASQAAMAIENDRSLRELEKLSKSLEQEVKDRTEELEDKVAELERFNSLVIGRELNMIELKKKIKKLEQER